MFEEIQKLFPNFGYYRDFYDKYRENPSIDELLKLAHQQISETTGHLTTSYGWFFRDCINPELGEDSNYTPRQIKKEKTDISCKVLFFKNGEVVREIPEDSPRFILDQQLKSNGWCYSGSTFQSPRDTILWIDCKHQKTLDYTALLSESFIGFDEEKGLPLFHFIDDEVVPLIAELITPFRKCNSLVLNTSNNFITTIILIRQTIV